MYKKTNFNICVQFYYGQPILTNRFEIYSKMSSITEFYNEGYLFY